MSGVKTAIAVWRQLEKNKNGYSQGPWQRWSAVVRWVKGTALSTTQALGLVAKNKELDCSSSWAMGIDMAYGTTMHSGTCYTGNIASLARRAGFHRVKRYDSTKSPQAQGKPGGAFLTPGRHIVSLLDNGECLNAVVNERGKILGGKPGDQTGREVRIDKWYKRPGGWVYNIVPITASEFKGAVPYAYAKLRKSYSGLLAKLIIVASADGPLFKSFMKAWEALDAGLAVAHDGSELVDVPASGHAFVILGGTVTQMKRRVAAAVTALSATDPSDATKLRWPNSLVVVSGGTKRTDEDGKTKTEAAIMKRLLLAAGMAESRIVLEERSFSTIGNALYSVPVLKAKGVKACTIVSYESHQRRAGVLFRAAKLKIETAGEGAHPFELQFLVPLAYQDKAVANTPASAGTRAEIGKEVAALLGLSNYYKEI